MSDIKDSKDSVPVNPPNDTKAIILSVACFLTYFFYGACYSSLGAALPTLANKLGVSDSSFGIAFTTRGIGFLTGTVLSAYLAHMPNFCWSKPFLAAVFLLVNALMLFIIAGATSFALVVLMVSLQGVGFGGIDMLMNLAIPEIWGPARAQPWLQATYTFFGVGAIIGPILVGSIGFQTSFYVFAICCFVPLVVLLGDHFYKPTQSSGDVSIKSEVMSPLPYNETAISDANKIDPNFTHTLIGTIARGNNFETLVHRKPSRLHLDSSHQPHPKRQKHNYSHVGNVKIPHKSYPLGHVYGDHPHSAPPSLKSSGEDGTETDNNATADTEMVRGHGHGKHVNHFKHHYPHKHHRAKSHGAAPNEDDLEANNNSTALHSQERSDSGALNSPSAPASMTQGSTEASNNANISDVLSVTSAAESTTSTRRKVVKANKPLPRHIMVIIMCFYFLISPLYSYGGWVASYAIQADVTSSDSDAAFLPAIFWAAMAAGRFTAIFLAMRFTATRMLRIKLVLLAVFSSALLAAGGSNYINLCVLTALLGYGLSSVYPLAITIVGDYGFVADENSTFFFIVASNIGDCTLPLTIGMLMTNVGPMSLVVAVFISSFTMIGLYLTQNYLSRGIQRKNAEDDLALYLKDHPVPVAEGDGDSSGVVAIAGGVSTGDSPVTVEGEGELEARLLNTSADGGDVVSSEGAADNQV